MGSNYRIIPVGGGGGITPEGEINLIGNGTYSVAQYETANIMFKDYLCFTAEEANSTIGFSLDPNGTAPNIEYTRDLQTWTTWDFTTITLQDVGDKIYMRGANPTGINYNPNSILPTRSKFTMSGKIAASGDTFTLIDKYGIAGNVVPFGCFAYLFSGCVALTSAPKLDWTTLSDYCYANMFNGCTTLADTPELPAIILTANCYNGMFRGCTSLVTAPALPATALAQSCYTNMFVGCTSLPVAPYLPATTLVDGCYSFMFYNCSSLNEITVEFTNWDSTYTFNWVGGNVPQSGDFYNNDNAEIPVGANGIPTGWTEHK